MSIEQSYNYIIRLIVEEKYEEAQERIYTVLDLHPDEPLFKYALGLVYAYTGYPYKAIDLWGNLETNFANHSEFKQSIMGKLSCYHSIYREFNKVLELIKERNYGIARERLKSLFEYQDQLILPIDIYHSYYMLLMLNGEYDLIERELVNAPVHITNSSRIRKILDQIKYIKNENTSPKRKNNARLIRILTGGLALILTTIIIVHGTKLGKNEYMNANEHQLKEIAIEEMAGIVEIGKFSTNDEDFLNDILDEITIIDEYSPEVGRGLIAYTNGYQAYKNKDYAEAIMYFEESLSIIPNTYFSDDAHFFLMHAILRNDGDQEVLFDLIQEFLKKKNSVYADSPYHDEVLLLKAELLLESENEGRGNVILQDITHHYPMEWTGEVARRLLEKE